MYLVLSLLFMFMSAVYFAAYYSKSARPIATRFFFVQVFIIILIGMTVAGFLLSPEPDSSCPTVGECLTPAVQSTFKGLIVGLFTASVVVLYSRPMIRRMLERTPSIWFITGIVTAALAILMIILISMVP